MLFADEALCDLGTFAFVASNLFSTGGRHLSAVAELLRLIKSLEYLNTRVQGMISSSNLTTTLLYNVSQCWGLYLIMCVATSDSKALEAPGAKFLFSPEPILVEIEGGAMWARSLQDHW